MVFKSGLVTRLKCISSWLSSNKHIYTKPFRKDNNINSITSILPTGPIPLLSPLTPWKNLDFLHSIFFFFLIYYTVFLILTVIPTLNSDWVLLTHLRTMTFLLSNAHRRWPNSHLNLLFSVFIQHCTALEISSYIYLVCNILWAWYTIKTQTLVCPSNYWFPFLQLVPFLLYDIPNAVLSKRMWDFCVKKKKKKNHNL